MTWSGKLLRCMIICSRAEPRPPHRRRPSGIWWMKITSLNSASAYCRDCCLQKILLPAKNLPARRTSSIRLQQIINLIAVSSLPHLPLRARNRHPSVFPHIPCEHHEVIFITLSLPPPTKWSARISLWDGAFAMTAPCNVMLFICLLLIIFGLIHFYLGGILPKIATKFSRRSAGFSLEHA